MMIATEGSDLIPHSGNDHRDVAAFALMLAYFVLFASAGLTIALAAHFR